MGDLAVKESRLLTWLVVATRVLIPVVFGVTTWGWLSDGRWPLGALGVVATAGGAVLTWRTVEVWMVEIRRSRSPLEQLVAVMKLRPSQLQTEGGVDPGSCTAGCRQLV
jgi:hypothetical protein